MTKKEVIAKWNSLSPRERDAWIAETVMGLKLDKHIPGNCLKNSMSIPIYRYSSYTSVAWGVIEKMQGEWSWEMKMTNAAQEVDVRIGKGYATSENVPEAICLAALIAHYEGQSETN